VREAAVPAERLGLGVLGQLCEAALDRQADRAAVEWALGRWRELDAAFSTPERRHAQDALEIEGSELLDLSLAIGRGLPAAQIAARLSAWRRRSHETRH